MASSGAEHAANRHEGRVKSGHVHCGNSDWISKAKGILERTGGEEISSDRESAADLAVSDKPHIRRSGGGTGA